MALRHIEISRIMPNPNNPRGLDIAAQDDKLPALKDSISKFGVMVPIVVTPRDGKYLLIDGERRYIASKSLKLEKIPAFVTESDVEDDDILFRMFQIHHNREQWRPIQQCHALEKTYQRIKRRSKIVSIEDEKAKVQAIAEELSSATGIETRTAIDRIKFLRWPLSVKRSLYDRPTDAYWYICEIEEKIIIPAMRNYPEYFSTVPPDEVRVDLYEKLKHHSVGKATDVRKVTKVFATSMEKKKDRKKITGLLSRLRRDKEMTYGEAEEEFVAAFPTVIQRKPLSPRKLVSLLDWVGIALSEFDFDSVRTATRRAKATPLEIRTAAGNLNLSLTTFLDELPQGKDK
jgi:ParB family transcriptional regulator, chromosome partitioning protein